MRWQISSPLAVTMVRTLSGLPGYPFHVEGESRLAKILAENAVNVEHGRYVLDCFDEGCPTPRSLADALLNDTVRERFGVRKTSERERWERENGAAGRGDAYEEPAPTPEQIEEWKREGATYDPKFTAGILAKLTAKDTDAEELPGLEAEFWDGIKRHKAAAKKMWDALQQKLAPGERSLQRFPVSTILRAQADLGYPLTPEQRRLIG